MEADESNFSFLVFRPVQNTYMHVTVGVANKFLSLVQPAPTVRGEFGTKVLGRLPPEGLDHS